MVALRGRLNLWDMAVREADKSHYKLLIIIVIFSISLFQSTTYPILL